MRNETMKVLIILLLVFTQFVFADEGPRFWPKANIPIIQPRQRSPEPAPVRPPRNGGYWLICKERGNLYWFDTDGRHGSLLGNALLRSPVAMTYGPDGRILVIDLPKLRSDPALLWAISPEGEARTIGQWPRGDHAIPLKWPSQILWYDRGLLIGDQDGGLLYYQPGQNLRQLMAAEMTKGRFGGLALAPGDQLIFAHGFTSRSRGNVDSGIRMFNGNGEVLSLDLRRGALSHLLEDDSALLWFPRAMVVATDGTPYIVDEGKRESTSKVYTGAYLSNVTETNAHGFGSLLSFRNGRLDRVPLSAAGHGLRHPWGLELDRDGALLISDPAMPDSSGRINGAVLRYLPEIGAEYLFQGQPWCQPLGVLPR